MGRLATLPVDLPTGLRDAQRTSLLSVAARAASLGVAGFTDPSSQEVAAALGAPMPRAGRLTRAAVLGSTLVLDELVGTWATTHPRGTVVTVGVGLCTRFRRLAHLPVGWLDVDQPPTLAVRRHALPDAPPSAVGGMDPGDWFGLLPAGPVLVVVEGVAMYVPRATVDAAVHAYRRAGFAFLIETVGVAPAHLSRLRHHTPHSDGCAFLWGGDLTDTVVPTLSRARAHLGGWWTPLRACGAARWVRVSVEGV